MTDDEMYKILEDFANSHTLSNDIVVRIESGHTSYTPRFPSTSFKHEDCEILSELVRGATHFMYWLRREGKARVVKLSSDNRQTISDKCMNSKAKSMQSIRKGAKRAVIGHNAQKKRHK